MAYMEEPYVFSDGVYLHIHDKEGGSATIDMEEFDELVMMRMAQIDQHTMIAAMLRIRNKPETLGAKALNSYVTTRKREEN